MQQSFVQSHGPNGGTSLVGPDAINLMRAITTRQGIKLHRDTGIMLTRGATITFLFNLATTYTGKKYKRKQHDEAIADLTTWIDTMKAAIPRLNEKGEVLV